MVADAHEEDDDRRGHPLANGEGCERAEAHQRVRGDPAPNRRGDGLAKHGRARDQHDRRAGRPGHAPGHGVEESEPLPHHRDEKDQTEHNSEEGEHGARESAERRTPPALPGRPGRAGGQNRNSVAGSLHRLADG